MTLHLTWSSENCIPFSSIQALITCCNSRCWIKPSPGHLRNIMDMSKSKILNYHSTRDECEHTHTHTWALNVCEHAHIFFLDRIRRESHLYTHTHTTSIRNFQYFEYHQSKNVCLFFSNLFCFSLTINIIDFEKKFYLIFGWLASELMNCINELLQWYWAGIVFVEDLKHSVGEEWLLWERERAHVKVAICWRNSKIICLTFFEVTIFLKSSRRISFSLPTVLRNNCSSRSNELLSNPVLGLQNGIKSKGVIAYFLLLCGKLS